MSAVNHSPRFQAVSDCPLCAGKGEVYDDEAEGWLLCFCREHGKPPRQPQTHCLRCVSEARGFNAAVACQWCTPGSHSLCEAHK